MIGIDWGTSSFRAFRIAQDGSIRDRRSGPRGILKVQDGRFADTLREEIGPWLAGGESQVLLCGMIGSRQGWIEAPYIPCPAGPTEIAAVLTDIPFDWAQVKLVPGLSAVDRAGVPELLRGESRSCWERWALWAPPVMRACPAVIRNGCASKAGGSSGSRRI